MGKEAIPGNSQMKYAAFVVTAAHGIGQCGHRTPVTGVLVVTLATYKGRKHNKAR